MVSGGIYGVMRQDMVSIPIQLFISFQPRNIPDKWEHDMYDGAGRRSSAGGSSGGLTTGGQLQISNLDFGVTESDIRVWFKYPSCIFWEIMTLFVFLGSFYRRNNLRKVSRDASVICSWFNCRK